MQHLEHFRASMNTDAVILHRPENMQYVAGYTGEGCVLIGSEYAAVITDFRYIELTHRECPGWPVFRTTNVYSEADALKEIVQAQGFKTVALETDYLTHDGFITIEKALEGAALSSVGSRIIDLRETKDQAEIDCIVKASAIACQAFENILPKMHAGMTEKQVRNMLNFEMLALGSEGEAFNTIAAAGINGALPHAVPSDYVIRKGDLLTLDFGAKVGGYLSDMTRTVGFAPVGEELRTLYDTVLTAQQMALDAIHPGADGKAVDKIARDYIDARYPGCFGHSLGHGVGLFIHEQPRLSVASRDILHAGHVVTVEPGIYVPGLGGCRIEDTIIMTEDGFIDPITSPKQLIEL